MYVSRRNQDVIFKSFLSPFVSALLGSRRVGKSTLVQKFAEENSDKKWVFLNMDIRAERDRVGEDQLERLIEERARQKIQPGSPLWVVIDEAQKCPPLFEQIKVLYDRFKGRSAIKFLLTGSGFLTLHQLAAETLAGRIEIHHLREFNLLESVSLVERVKFDFASLFECLSCDDPYEPLRDLIQTLSPHRPSLQTALQRQMIWGGLPEVLEIQDGDPEGRIAYLGNYLQTYLEKDVRDIGTLSDLHLYQKMMEIIAMQTGSVREDKKLIDVLGCSRDTLKKYRGYLEATLVYRELYPYIGSPLKRLVKSPKGYLTNNGLVSYLTGLYDPKILEGTGKIGHRFENRVLKEIQIWLDRDPRQSEIYFWRTSGQVEVDFVVVKHPQVIPFEVTCATRRDTRKVKHLSSFLAEEKRARFGFTIYNGELDYDKERKIFFLPAWALG